MTHERTKLEVASIDRTLVENTMSELENNILWLKIILQNQQKNVKWFQNKVETTITNLTNQKQTRVCKPKDRLAKWKNSFSSDKISTPMKSNKTENQNHTKSIKTSINYSITVSMWNLYPSKGSVASTRHHATSNIAKQLQTLQRPAISQIPYLPSFTNRWFKTNKKASCNRVFSLLYLLRYAQTARRTASPWAAPLFELTNNTIGHFCAATRATIYRMRMKWKEKYDKDYHSS
jgi:hypothetical protein